MIAARLRRELEDPLANRAHLNRLLLDGLEAALGAAAAERLLVRVRERCGREVREALFRHMPPEHAGAPAQTFLAAGPDGGRLSPHEVGPHGGRTTIPVVCCRLLDGSRALDLAADRIARLCRLADAFDHRMFEGAGIRLDGSTRGSARGGCCRIFLESKPVPKPAPAGATS